MLFALPIKAKKYEVSYFVDKSLSVFGYALLPMYSMVGIFIKVECWTVIINPLLIKLIFDLKDTPLYLKAPNGFVQLIAADELALFDWMYLFAGYWI